MFGISNVKLFLENCPYPDFWKAAVRKQAARMSGRRRIFLDEAAYELMGQARGDSFLRAVKRDPLHEARLCTDLLLDRGGEAQAGRTHGTDAGD